MILVYRLNPLKHFIRQLQLEAGDVALQLLQGCGTNDVAGHERLLRDERQRHLRRVQAVFAGLEQLDSNIASADLTLSKDVLEGIEAIQKDHPNPAP